MTMIDFSEIGPQIVRDRPLSEFAPKRVRQDRPQSEITPPPSAVETMRPLETEEFSRNALVFYEGVQSMQAESKRLREESAEQKARIEQFQSRVTELQSQLEFSRLETAEANRRTDEVREKLAQFKAMAQNIGGILADMLQEQT